MHRPVRAQYEDQNNFSTTASRMEQIVDKLAQLVETTHKINKKSEQKEIKCFYCGGMGHIRRECKKRKRDLENNVQQTQNEMRKTNVASRNILPGNQTRLG